MATPLLLSELPADKRGGCVGPFFGNEYDDGPCDVPSCGPCSMRRNPQMVSYLRDKTVSELETSILLAQDQAVAARSRAERLRKEADEADAVLGRLEAELFVARELLREKRECYRSVGGE